MQTKPSSARGRRRLRLTTAVTAAILATVTAIPADAAPGTEAVPPGTIDSTFGVDGTAIVDLGGFETSRAIVALDDGGFLVAGNRFDGSQNDAFVARFDSAGALDPDYGSDGVALLSAAESIYDLVPLPDGGVVGFGIQDTLATLVSVSASGAPGLVTTVAVGDFASFLGGRLLADGGFLAVGTTRDGDERGVLVVRFDPTGQPDPTFGGGDGIVVLEGGGNDFGAGAVETADGRLLVVGNAEIETLTSSEGVALIFRLLPDGTPDPAFGGGDGLVEIDRPRNVYFEDVEPQGDGFVAVGEAYTDDPAESAALVVRLRPGGAFDPGWGEGGIVEVEDVGGGALAVDEQQRVIIGGLIDLDMVFARLLANGEIDPVFGTDGVVPVPPSPDGLRRGSSAAIDAAGRLVIAGTLDADAGDDEVSLWRYTNRDARCGGEAVTVYLSRGDRPTAGDDVVLGTSAPDRIRTRGGADVVCGLGGRDEVFGGAGRDRLIGGSSRDLLDGGGGDDRLVGGSDDDRLLGRAGDDRLVGGPGEDRCRGGAGDDVTVSCP